MGPDDLKHSFYLRAIRTSIGAGLRAHYTVHEPLTDRMTKLLKELEEAETEVRHKASSKNELAKSKPVTKR